MNFYLAPEVIEQIQKHYWETKLCGVTPWNVKDYLNKAIKHDGMNLTEILDNGFSVLETSMSEVKVFFTGNPFKFTGQTPADDNGNYKMFWVHPNNSELKVFTKHNLFV